jgi:hypothetical protein
MRSEPEVGANTAAYERDRYIGNRHELVEIEFAAQEDVWRQRPLESAADANVPEQRISLLRAVSCILWLAKWVVYRGADVTALGQQATC